MTEMEDPKRSVPAPPLAIPPGNRDPSEAAQPSGEAGAPAEQTEPGEKLVSTGHGSDPDLEDSDEIRNLLRGALADRVSRTPDVLGGVQRKLRLRSRGKFYADGWSTTRQPPIATYFITSLFMLLVMLFVWALLSPLSGEPAKAEPPAPIDVIPAPRMR